MLHSVSHAVRRWPGLTGPHGCLGSAHVPCGKPVSTFPGYALSRAMRVHEQITRKLTEAFNPDNVRVVDESDHHAGHAGHRPGGQTHFRVYMVAEAFRGKTRLERHRMINALLDAE